METGDDGDEDNDDDEESERCKLFVFTVILASCSRGKILLARTSSSLDEDEEMSEVAGELEHVADAALVAC